MMNVCLKLTVAAAVAIAFDASGQTYTPPTSSPRIEKVTQPSAVKQLAVSTHSRVSISPGAASDGVRDYTSQWPGVYFDAAFRGTALYLTVGPGRAIFHLVIDSQPPLILADPQPGVYRVVGLPDSRHSATLFIATESFSGPNHFGGFAIPADEDELIAIKNSRQIEFIGDSFTVGYGNTSPQHNCSVLQGGVYAATDNTLAFGASTAAHFRADYQVNAISGRGVVRNYNGGPGDALPVAYPFVLFDKQQPYVDPNWNPQWLVVSLGTNDFTTSLRPNEKWKSRDSLHADFEQTYLEFLHRLRAKNPEAFIIVWATNLAGGEIASEGKHVVDTMRSSGERKIAFMSFDQLTFTGCDAHPSVADDKTISAKLVEFMEDHLATWQGR